MLGEEENKMKRKLSIYLSACVIAAGLVCLPAIAADDDDKKPKYTIKQVMGKAFKGPLLKKVAKGDASDEEKKQLHEMLVSMSKQKPPRGEEASWKKLNGVLVAAAKGVVDGDKDAAGKLKKGANCKACHKEHKPAK